MVKSRLQSPPQHFAPGDEDSAHPLGRAGALGNAAVQNLLRGAPRSLQRQDEPGEAGAGTSSLLGGEGLTLDPELLAQMRAMQLVDQLLNPAALRPNLFDLPASLIAAPEPDIFSGPATPTAKPLVPRGRGPARPRRAEASDVLEAVMALPAVDSALTRLQTMARQRVSGFYQGLSRGEKAAAISTVAVVGAGALAGIAANPDARSFALDQLNGRVLPVPGVDGLGVELNTEGDNVMVGFHLDIGALLPASLGFGASEASPIGAPPAMRQLTSEAGDAKEEPDHAALDPHL